MAKEWDVRGGYGKGQLHCLSLIDVLHIRPILYAR